MRISNLLISQSDETNLYTQKDRHRHILGSVTSRCVCDAERNSNVRGRLMETKGRSIDDYENYFIDDDNIVHERRHYN